MLTDATYSPCGDCIDAKGNRIGWKVHAARMVQDPVSNQITIEQPRLEVLGVPIAWLPWVSLPDPSKPRQSGFQLPTVDYSNERGLVVGVPYYIAAGESTDIMLRPQLMSRQGFLMAAEWEQRFDYGQMNLSASGLYQLDPVAFSGEVGDRQWRGAIQSSGHFQVAENWTAGWSATAFSDANYLKDYDIDGSDSLINEVYTTYLTDDYYADLRIQQYLVMGDYTEADQDKQALAIPNLARRCLQQFRGLRAAARDFERARRIARRGFDRQLMARFPTRSAMRARSCTPWSRRLGRSSSSSPAGWW